MIVDEASCRSLILLGDGLGCTVLGDEVFSQRIDLMLLQEIFQTPFSSCNRMYCIHVPGHDLLIFFFPVLYLFFFFLFFFLFFFFFF